MNKKTSNIFRIIVGIVFLILGAVGVYNSLTLLVKIIGNGNAIGFGTIWGLAINIVMLAAGLLALLKAKKSVCIILTIILFIGFVVDAITGLVNNSGVWNVIWSIAEAVCSFLFIGCVDRTSTNRSLKK